MRLDHQWSRQVCDTAQRLVEFLADKRGALEADLNGRMAAPFKPFNKARDLRRAARAVRAFNDRRISLTFDHIDSIGLKSGEYGGRKHAIAPADSIAAITRASLWADRLSITTMSRGRRIRRSSPPANACITDTSVPPS